MKFLSSLFATLLSEREMRQNLRALARFLMLLLGLIVLFTVVFHVIMVEVEGQSHSWLTGLYWTLVVMTTLGFGDITFTSDAGRLFSIAVLMTGVVLLLVVMPFMFIRYFYAPWLEAKVRLRAPRRVPEGTRGHVIIARYDAIAAGLVQRLRELAIPYFVIEPDPTVAAHMVADEVAVVAGEVDSRTTYEALRVEHAHLMVVNCEDTTNTNITLTVREVAPEVPIVGTASDEDAVEILRLSGCNEVLPLKQWLGEHIANRADTGRPEAHVIGGFKGLQVAEFAVRNTPLAGKVVRDTHLRASTGLNVVGVWERGRLQPAFPHTPLREHSVAVVVGTAEQVGAFEDVLHAGDTPPRPVLILGCGKVGRAAATALHRRGIPVFALDREPSRIERLRGVAARLTAGDAADHDDLTAAGLEEASTALLTTNDDATNIYLAVYCRRLRPELRIVSRITHERNVEAIHRAGADFVLSYATLGVDALLSIVQGQELWILGEGVDLFSVPLPASLEDRTLAETGIGSRTGLAVVAVEHDGRLVNVLSSSMVLKPGSELVMLGSLEQRRAFAAAFAGR